MASRVSALSHGYDMCSAAPVKVPARGSALISLDISIALPNHAYARIIQRPELLVHSIFVRDEVIHADNREHVSVILVNHSDMNFFVKHDDRVAKHVIHVKLTTPDFVETEDLDSIRAN